MTDTGAAYRQPRSTRSAAAAVRDLHPAYEPTLWSVVFPLGMCSVATLSFGYAAQLSFMEPLARFMFWVSVAAWVAVAAAFLYRLARGPGVSGTGAPAAPASTTATTG